MLSDLRAAIRQEPEVKAALIHATAIAAIFVLGFILTSNRVVSTPPAVQPSWPIISGELLLKHAEHGRVKKIAFFQDAAVALIAEQAQPVVSWSVGQTRNQLDRTLREVGIKPMVLADSFADRIRTGAERAKPLLEVSAPTLVALTATWLSAVLIALFTFRNRARILMQRLKASRPSGTARATTETAA